MLEFCTLVAFHLNMSFVLFFESEIENSLYMQSLGKVRQYDSAKNAEYEREDDIGKAKKCKSYLKIEG